MSTPPASTPAQPHRSTDTFLLFSILLFAEYSIIANRRFTMSVRHLFLHAWTDLLDGYETYVIVPEDSEGWLEGT